MTLSASKIATYLQCPRKYRFRYVERLPSPWKAAALALGSAVHGALETFHEQRMTGGVLSPEATVALFRIDLAAELVDEVRFKEDESAEDLLATGEALVQMYASTNQNLAVSGAEVQFEIEVVKGVMLRGVFDALVQGDRIRELKTAARDYDQGSLSRNVQISAYAFAHTALFRREAVIEIVALLKHKRPRIEKHEVSRTPAQLSWFVQLVREVADAIEVCAFPPNPSWACSDCEYAEPCRAIGSAP